MARLRPPARELWDGMMAAMGAEPGALEPAERAAVVAHVTEGSAADLPAAVSTFADKVATESYKVVERDVQAMRDEGYSDAAILELTLAAAAASAHRGVLAYRAALAGDEESDAAE